MSNVPDFMIDANIINVVKTGSESDSNNLIGSLVMSDGTLMGIEISVITKDVFRRVIRIRLDGVLWDELKITDESIRMFNEISDLAWDTKEKERVLLNKSIKSRLLANEK